MMRVAVVSSWNETYDCIAQITHDRMEDYCKRHGYTLCTYHNRFHFNPEDLLTFGDRDKLQIYKDLYDKYDAIAWLDIDCLITNPEKPLHGLAIANDFTWTYDVMGPLSGFWVARCVPSVYRFLHAVQHKAVEMRDSERAPNGESDQTAMRALMNLPPFREVAGNPLSCKTVGHCWDYSLYGWEMWGKDSEENIGDWTPGDLLYTAPSMPLPRRIELLTAKAAETA